MKLFKFKNLVKALIFSYSISLFFPYAVFANQFHTRSMAAQNSWNTRSELRSAQELFSSSGMLEHNAGITVPLALENEYILHEFRNLVSKLRVWFETFKSEFELQDIKNESVRDVVKLLRQYLQVLSAYDELKAGNNSQATKDWLKIVQTEFQDRKLEELINILTDNFPATFGSFFPKDKTISNIKIVSKMISAQAGLMSGARFTEIKKFQIREILDFFAIAEPKKVFVENSAPNMVLNSDELAFFMVLKNLIRNALDAGADRVIIMTNLIAENELQIQVVDNGAGIRPEVLPKIFDVGFSTKVKGIGAGLGLPLTKQMVEKRLNGDIGVRSLEGSGTRFIFRIPVDKAKSELRTEEGIRFLERVEREHSNEVLAIFGRNGKLKKKGKDKRSVHRDGDWHRSVKMLVISEEDGSVVFQKRFEKSNKPEHDGKLHVSVSGHIKHGESVRNAAIREFQEELGVRPKEKNLIKISENDKVLLSSRLNGRIDNERTTIFVYRASLEEIQKMNVKLDHGAIERLALVSPDRFLDLINGNEEDRQVFSKKAVDFAVNYPNIFLNILPSAGVSNPDIISKIKSLQKRSELRNFFGDLKLRPDHSQTQLVARSVSSIIKAVSQNSHSRFPDKLRKLFLTIFGFGSDNSADIRTGFILSYGLAYDESFLLLLDKASEALGKAHPIFVVRGSSGESVLVKGANARLKHLPKSSRIQVASNYSDARTQLLADYGVRQLRLLVAEDESIVYYLNQGFEKDEIQKVSAGDIQSLFSALGVSDSILQEFQEARLQAQFA